MDGKNDEQDFCKATGADSLDFKSKKRVVTPIKEKGTEQKDVTMNMGKKKWVMPPP